MGLIAITVEGTVTLGSLLIGIAIIVIGAFLTARSNSGKTWREEAEAHKAATNRFKALADERDRQLEQQAAQLQQLQEALSSVGGRNVYEQLLQESSREAERYEQAVATMLASFTSLNARVDRHEQRADERHGALLSVLEMIAARLGPDNGE